MKAAPNFPSLTRTNIGPVPAHTAAASAAMLPLCQRPAVHVDELGAVMSWRDHMSGLIAQLGDSLEHMDGGPDKAGLLGALRWVEVLGREAALGCRSGAGGATGGERELDWVLDDVIEAVRVRPESPWEETSWRLLEPRVRTEETRGHDPRVTWQLRLREPVSQLWEWWERRLKDRVPFQYLISTAHWHKYVLSVGPGVLVPRPETEIFPELVRTAISERPYLAAAPWADLGTGSGAIAIAAADELRRVTLSVEVWAVDLSPRAVAYATFNAQLCLPSPPSTGAGGSGGGGRPLVRVVQGSWFEPLRHLRGRLGGVLTNPPYIPRAQMSGLQAEVRLHEPRGALDGGEGPGLDSLEILCSDAAAMMLPGGLIALETAGGDQAELVAELLRGVREPPSCGALDVIDTTASSSTRLNTATMDKNNSTSNSSHSSAGENDAALTRGSVRGLCTEA
ncbi:hypothetical protein VOLCADRAFT_98562 [Volvox carteri f. nagariensis]|uniref:Methyltransferase small domain-containing protein n=1 Tax=Volvox carteri f. nagariensis TaxID=3068 RepID=D8UFP0_VOLCA|nr:uncharacterized protein VOLCADRAFT_98562 [Volvox carteri f. nagariensis]EFJ41493.1 hypothetical protein VOLCADRAFT_98562 [Volvox carteri f. nagariensis]|eukprot:XP_002957438.1 hypothetical protein VOLCADRAFT_98562 [Volvox carteri f. nagariensis]